MMSRMSLTVAFSGIVISSALRSPSAVKLVPSSFTVPIWMRSVPPPTTASALAKLRVATVWLCASCFTTSEWLPVAPPLLLPPVAWTWSSLLLLAVVAFQVSCLISFSAAVCSSESADFTVPQAESLVLMPACSFCSLASGARSTFISCETMLLTSREPPIAVIFPAIGTSCGSLTVFDAHHIGAETAFISPMPTGGAGAMPVGRSGFWKSWVKPGLKRRRPESPKRGFPAGEGQAAEAAWGHCRSAQQRQHVVGQGVGLRQH